MNPDSLIPIPRLASLACLIVATIPCARAGTIARSAAFSVTNQAVTQMVTGCDSRMP